MTAYDVVVVGAGHNGLTLAAYLARAGLKVGVFEAASNIGGGASTEDVTLPGFRHNLHSMLHYWIAYGPTFSELELPARGARYIYPEAQYALVFEDGRSLVLYRDLERTCAQIAQFSKADADAYRDLYMRYSPMLPLLMEAVFQPPMAPSLAPRALEKNIEGLELLRMQACSPRTLINETLRERSGQAHRDRRWPCNWSGPRGRLRCESTSRGRLERRDPSDDARSRWRDESGAVIRAQGAPVQVRCDRALHSASRVE
ncbi:MAG: phytoene desaturase family protein [Actinomycetota bacterium]